MEVFFLYGGELFRTVTFLASHVCLELFTLIMASISPPSIYVMYASMIWFNAVIHLNF